MPSFQTFQLNHKTSICLCVLKGNMLLAGFFIEQADPSMPHISRVPNTQILCGRWTGLEFCEQWGGFVGCRVQRDGHGASSRKWQDITPSKPLASYSVKGVKQWSVPKSHCISNLLLLWGKKSRSISVPRLPMCQTVNIWARRNWAAKFVKAIKIGKRM